MSSNFKSLRVVGDCAIYAKVRDTQRISILIKAIYDRKGYPNQSVTLYNKNNELNGVSNADMISCKYYARRRKL